MSESDTIYGWITKNNPTVKFVGINKGKVFIQERLISERVLLFECSLNCSFICFTGPMPKKEHHKQIKGFVSLMMHSGNPLPACEANAGDVRILS